MNIVLIGFMGSGKSSVARHLSALLGHACLEMDDLVLEKTGSKDMHEVFAKGGELLVRETEIAIAKEYAAHSNLVISTGGGVVMNQIILDFFKKNGAKIVYLQTSFDEIARRLENDRARPLFQDMQSAKKLYDFRLPLYLNAADLIIDTEGRSPQEIAIQAQGVLHGI